MTRVVNSVVCVIGVLCLWVLLLLPVPANAARLFTSGFEENCTTTCMWATSAGNAATIVTTNPRHSGAYRLDTSAVAGNSSLTYSLATTITSGTLFSRTYFKSSTATPSAESTIYSDQSSTASLALQIGITTTGAVKLTNVVGGETATSSTTLAANTDYRVEARHLLGDGTAGELEVRLFVGDTTSILETLSLTGIDTLPTNIQTIRVGKTASTATFSYDDVALNDTSGAFQNSWVGPGKVFLLKPATDVSIQWTKQGGGAATFSGVADVPGAPDDGTTYNESAALLTDVDRLGLTNLDAEVPSDATIKLVAVYGRFGSTQTAATHMRFKLYDEGGTLTNGPSMTANVNGWRLPSSAEYLIYDATGKTKAHLDSFDVGYEAITDVIAGKPRRVTAIWATVEWLEASGGPVLRSNGAPRAVFH